jgi:hypothetical protein
VNVAKRSKIMEVESNEDDDEESNEFLKMNDNYKEDNGINLSDLEDEQK